MSIKQWDSNTQTANTVVGSQFERNTIDDTTPSTDKVYSSSKVQGELDNINTSLTNFSDIGKSLKYKDFQVSPITYYEPNTVNSGIISLPTDCTTVLAITVYTYNQPKFLCGQGNDVGNLQWTVKNVHTSGLNTSVRVKILYI